MICLDTSILIDHFRKTNKENSIWYILSQQYDSFAISVFTQYEILSGSNKRQDIIWKSVFENLTILNIDRLVCEKVIDVERQLKLERKLIEPADLFIAATSIVYDLPLATLNKKHFSRVKDLRLIP